MICKQLQLASGENATRKWELYAKPYKRINLKTGNYFDRMACLAFISILIRQVGAIYYFSIKINNSRSQRIE